MSTTQTRKAIAAAPRTSALDRSTAMRLAATEYGRFLAQLRALTAADWAKETDCPGWDVRALASHVLGMAEMSASIRQQLHQMRRPAVGVASSSTLSPGCRSRSVPTSGRQR